MYDNEEWDAIRPHTGSSERLTNNALRASLLFGALIFGITLLAVPLLSESAEERIASRKAVGVDPITTATVRKPGDVYVMRKSVLQSKPTDVCIIRSNGLYEGDC